MSSKIERMFDRWLAKTGDPRAAATLVLAEVHSHPGEGDRPLNPPDVAQQLRVSPATVIGWIRTGQLKAANLATGNRPRYVIQRAELDRFLRSRQPEPPNPRRRSGRSKARMPADRY